MRRTGTPLSRRRHSHSLLPSGSQPGRRVDRISRVADFVEFRGEGRLYLVRIGYRQLVLEWQNTVSRQIVSLVGLTKLIEPRKPAGRAALWNFFGQKNARLANRFASLARCWR